jgi:hypothetical protein
MGVCIGVTVGSNGQFATVSLISSRASFTRAG